MSHSFRPVFVAETFNPDASVADDTVLPHVLGFVLRGVVEMSPPKTPLHDRGDWSVAEVYAAVAAADAVFVMLDPPPGGGCGVIQTGPKCFAAVKAAQLHGKPYSIVLPLLRYRTICGDVIDACEAAPEEQRRIVDDAEFKLVAVGTEDPGAALTVPMSCLTCSIDDVVKLMVAMMWPEATQ